MRMQPEFRVDPILSSQQHNQYLKIDPKYLVKKYNFRKRLVDSGELEEMDQKYRKRFREAGIELGVTKSSTRDLI